MAAPTLIMVSMSDTPFHYQDPFPLGPDTTEYEQIDSKGISTTECDGATILKIAPEALTLLANEASKAICFKLRTSHLKQVAAILDDPEASDNDRMVASDAAQKRRNRIPRHPPSLPRYRHGDCNGQKRPERAHHRQ